MFSELGWERLSDHNQYFKALMMYKSLHSLAPQYFTRKFKYVRDSQNCNTRQAAAGQLALPPLTHGNDIECIKSSLSYSRVKLWNGIDSTVRILRILILLRLTTGKNEKEYSCHVPAMKFIGMKKLV